MPKYISSTIIISILCIFGLVQDLKGQSPIHIINKAIQNHGSKTFKNADISFDFRGKSYTAKLDNGLYVYTKTWADTTGTYIDRLDNGSFNRTKNGTKVMLSEKDSRRFSNSLNSVIYFTLLPKGLQDPAVNATYKGKTQIRGSIYHQILVTFDEEGGGDDFEDSFMYWIHTENHTIDYLAYQFYVNKGGVRFREAIDQETIGGIRFQNYINYRPASKETALEDLPELFESRKLVKLSEIVNIDVVVE